MPFFSTRFAPFVRLPSVQFFFIAACSSLLISGCEPEPEPVYDDELGLQAVSVEPGALAGSFGVKTSSLGIAELPIIGEQFTGGNSYLLVERTWDAEAETYTQTFEMCGGRIFDTDASSSVIPTSTWRLAETFPPKTLQIDHELGTYNLEDYLELWGVRDLPDLYDTPFPEDGAAAKEEPHASRIFDMEDDGFPGATMQNYGFVEAEVYFIQRRTSGFNGLILSPDEMMGFLDWEKVQITLDASNPILNGNLEQKKHPDPKEHWFHEVRLADGADCDDVLDAVESELLSRLTPF